MKVETVLEAGEWQTRAAAHRARLAPFVDAHLARRSRREKHPVYDFLFEYYSFRPALLLRWSPGIGVELRGENGEIGNFKEWSPTPDGIALDPAKFPSHRVEGLLQIAQILEKTASRAAFHGCFGLHEWAMVYRESEHRHAAPLRLSNQEIAALVESGPIRCSHYDAFRFFTPAARPLNLLSPNADSRAEMEQPGCIHANMDLYKWAAKFHPWIASGILADAFEIAIEARVLDMRAAPYDLSSYGFEPIRIETASGRAEYGQLQREVAHKAAPVRAALIGAYRKVAEAVESAQNGLKN